MQQTIFVSILGPGVSNKGGRWPLIRVCNSCGAKNRVAAKHLAQTGRCGSCKAVLPATNEPIEVDGPTFDEIIRDARVPVLVDFWAAWCGPCRAIGPVIEELSKEYAGKVNIGKVNVDNNPDISVRYGITSIPAILFIKGGQVVDKQIGAVPKSVLDKKIAANL